MRYTIEKVPCRREDNRKRLFLTKYTCAATDPQKHILLIHGLTFTQHVFDIDYKDYSFMRFLAREGYTAWAVDIGGHGRSQRYKNGFDITTATAAVDVITALEKIKEETGMEKIDLLGWSWGTNIASTAAGQRPDLVNKLVLIGPATGGTMPAMPPEMFPDDKLPIEYEFAARLFRHKNLKSGEVSDSDEDEIDYDITEPGVVNLAMHNLIRYDLTDPKPQGPNRELFAAGDAWLIDAEPIKAPTLFVKGTDDIYSTEERVDILVSKLPEGSGKVTIRGGGHGLFFERDYYQKTRNVILDFLNK